MVYWNSYDNQKKNIWKKMYVSFCYLIQDLHSRYYVFLNIEYRPYYKTTIKEIKDEVLSQCSKNIFVETWDPRLRLYISQNFSSWNRNVVLISTSVTFSCWKDPGKPVDVSVPFDGKNLYLCLLMSHVDCSRMDLVLGALIFHLPSGLTIKSI